MFPSVTALLRAQWQNHLAGGAWPIAPLLVHGAISGLLCALVSTTLPAERYAVFALGLSAALLLYYPSMRALHEAAAQLPRIAIQKPAQVIGKDTVSAMQSGVFLGYVELIDGLVRRIKAEYGAPMSVVATGGVASLFEGASETIDHYDQDVLIRGLLEVWKRNR